MGRQGKRGDAGNEGEVGDARVRGRRRKGGEKQGRKGKGKGMEKEKERKRKKERGKGRGDGRPRLGRCSPVAAKVGRSWPEVAEDGWPKP